MLDIYGGIDPWMGGWMDGWMDGWIWMDMGGDSHHGGYG
jgi:hypothetical protein